MKHENVLSLFFQSITNKFRIDYSGLKVTGTAVIEPLYLCTSAPLYLCTFVLHLSLHLCTFAPLNKNLSFLKFILKPIAYRFIVELQTKKGDCNTGKQNANPYKITFLQRNFIVYYPGCIPIN